MRDFDIRSREYRKYVESFLEKWYSRFENEPQRPLFEAMQYSAAAPTACPALPPTPPWADSAICWWPWAAPPS